LFRDGQVCEDCVGTLPWRGVARGCYRGSVLASGVVAAGIVRQRQQVTHLVDVFIALTGFARERFIAGGLPAERIVVRPNFVRPATVRVGPRRGVLFVGRMSEEKGVTRLVQSWRGLPWPLTCVGDGPLLEALRRSPPRGVEFVGRKSGPEIAERLAAAQCLVVPSLVYEGFPLVIAEACRAGTPVVAPARGSLAEIVAGLGIGVLYDPVREGSLREALQQVLEPEALSRFSEAAFRAWTTKLSPEAAAESLEEIYAQAETTCRGRSTAGSRHRD
jgi:glycosyltransferase involved in cell wall biosynthesis